MPGDINSPDGKPVYRQARRLGIKLADEARFIKAWLDNPSITGAISPSGRQLARYMAMQVDISRPGPVIELGPGTGPVTQALVERGVTQERLVLVEYDAEFCALLARRFPGATIVQGDAYDLARTLAPNTLAPAAAIVSSLPLLLRDEPQRLALLADAFGLLQEGAPLIQFTYGLKSPIPRLAQIRERSFLSSRSAPIWLNLPPAHVWVYQQQADGAPAAAPKLDLFDRLGVRTRRMRSQVMVATRAMRAKLASRVEKARKAAR